MVKKSVKRILSALLCAAVLTGGAVSVSAAQVGQSEIDAAYSQRSSISDLVTITQDTILHGGQRISTFYVTAPSDAQIFEILVDKQFGAPANVTIDGNTAVVTDSGSATDTLYFTIKLVFPEDGSTAAVYKEVHPSM